MLASMSLSIVWAESLGLSDPVILSILGLIGVVLNGVIVVAVSALLQIRKTRTEASVKNEERETDELAAVRKEYREDIKNLKTEIKDLRDQKDREIKTLQDRLDEKDQEIESLRHERRTLNGQVDELQRQVRVLSAGQATP